ncbi:hypothetical protein [Nocardioides sp.]|uniref:hypothetical protein n=1 Tax=Nocardioides sp. TaxID=35761 RepID=UPI0026369179|nr:hypothetical protein [Nocardioides sp.]
MRLLHLVGSPTDDFHAELSLVYARGALASLQEGTDHEHVVAFVAPDGLWRLPDRPALDDATLGSTEPVELATALRRVREVGIDAALPQMFCRAGMTHYRALLDVLDLPYLGNDPATMALGADKARARAVVAAAGVPVPEGAVVRVGDPRPVFARPGSGGSGDVVVKPVDADNSAGVTLVRGGEPDAAYVAAVAAACRDDGSGRALVERYVPLGREVRCGVLATREGLVALPLEEYAVDEAASPVRLADSKLARDGAGDLGLVAKDVTRAWIVPADDPVVPAVHEAALAAYDALGCRHYGLFDLRIDPEGRPWFLEAGLYCSYAPTSVVATMARAAGIDLPALLQHGLDRLGLPAPAHSLGGTA